MINLISTIKRYLSPYTYRDINTFAQQLPEKAGQTSLLAGGLLWTIAAFALIFATVEAEKTAKIRAEILNQNAMTPQVPDIVKTAVQPILLETYAAKMEKQYPDLSITSDQSVVHISADDTKHFGKWREATSHLYNGGDGWRLSIEHLCVGRECDDQELSVKFSVNTLKIQEADRI